MSTRFSSLAFPDVRRYLTARFLVSIAVQMQTVAVGFQVYATTHNPLDLGLIGLSQFLPFVILVLPAGHIADRYDRRRVILACYLLAALASALLTAFAVLGVTAVLPIFIVMAMFGVVRAFNMPTSQALLPNLVPRADFGNAVALSTSTMQIATIAGPAVAGLLILAGTGVVYATVTVLIVISAWFIWRLRSGGGVDPEASEPPSLRTVLSGVRFVRDHPPILGSMSLDLFAVLFGGATALLPAFASDVLHVGPVGLGFLRAAPAVGAALAGAVLAVNPVRTAVGRWLFGGVFVFGLAIVVFGLSQSFWLSLISMGVLGAADMVSMYVRHLLVQLQTPDVIRGRVSAVNAVFIGASNELGEFESGVTAAWWGVVPAVLVGGVATLVVGVVWTRLFPMLWQLERFPDEPTPVERATSADEAVRGLSREAG